MEERRRVVGGLTFSLVQEGRPDAQAARGLSTDQAQEESRVKPALRMRSARRPVSFGRLRESAEGKDQEFCLEAERQLKEAMVQHELKTPDTLKPVRCSAYPASKAKRLSIFRSMQ
ncbi:MULTISPECIES: hypothetical protein [unclassified Bradyrhizobium]|uniref:hypothetical protein n=1 Tax=unclassified Bradyrhizobium TaxID=2631580 RepID=UPI001FF84DD9|nr:MULTISPECIES: hypothetical protein [unclassified Bradyrhizobium]MCK1714646.1 hypothetical protein [Bradyrhizobium sp. 143]MCK1730043.1 hypothetical protein [Bradyrhizobium sp. 142]